MLKKLLLAVPAATLLYLAGYQSGAQAAANDTNVYELRTYYTLPGRLDALNARFRGHTTKLFEKHGMKNIGYWIPQDEARKSNTLIYLLQHKSRAAADVSWKAFQADPEWVKARTASEESGKIVEKVERIWLDPVDYSALK
jgi:hypothetical protein